MNMFDRFRLMVGRIGVLVILWLMVVGLAVQRADLVWHGYDTATWPEDLRRADNNFAHTQIDFGGPWVMGRIVAQGRPRELYDRRTQWAIVREAYPRSAESPWVLRDSFPKVLKGQAFTPDDPRHDAEWLMYWFMGQDSPRWPEAGRALALPFASQDPYSVAARTILAERQLTPEVIAAVSEKTVGGPLYPPVQGFLMAPLGFIDQPQTAYRVMVGLLTVAIVLAAWGLSRIWRNRLPFPLALLLLLAYPGCAASLLLAQNSALTLAILVMGWLLLVRDREIAGGMVWGLLVYKPLWGATFFLVPWLMGRWRFCVAMVLSGAGLAAVTLPFVGVQTWLDWLTVGREASELYNVNRNWIWLSRDLFGIPRRFLLDFTLPEAQRNRLDATVVGWLIWLIITSGTAWVYRRHPERRNPRSFVTGFALLGAYLCCYRFVYYDAFVSAFPVVVLTVAATTTGRFRWIVWLFVAGLMVLENLLIRPGYQLEGTPLHTGVEYPWDTMLLIGLWLACVIRLRRSEAKSAIA